MATINGTAGNDTLTGTSGNDTISGLGGNDLILAGSTGGTDVVDGGAGFDSIEFASRATSAVIVDFAAVTISGGSSGTISFTSVERVVASNFNDRLSGNGSGQTLAGQAGADTLWGAGGIDTLWGGGGADNFVFRETGAHADSVRDFSSGTDKLLLDGSVMSALGATGNFAAGDARFKANSTGTATDTSDRVLYNTATREVFYDADGNGSGAKVLIATLQSGATLVATDIAVEGGSGGGQTINGTPGNDSLVGGPGNDTINGFDGNDTIDGGPGADSMTGGAHADTYFVDNPGDVIVELEDGGFDTVNSSVSYTLPAWVNHLTLTGTASIDGNGNDLPNVITGNSANNNLNGDAGDDTIFGGDGSDRIEGDLIDDVHGHDYIDGGAGDDNIRGHQGDDTLIGGAGNDHFVITSGYPEFQGPPGNDSIDGGAGVDSIGFGIEEVSTTAAVTIDLGAGTYSIADPAGQVNGIVLNVENVQGSAFADRITGTEGANVLHALTGNDTIHGLGGDDLLLAERGHQSFLGGAGNDSLNGGTGRDTLSGGLGNDVLRGNYTGFPQTDEDSFLFDVAPGSANADLIQEFTFAQDKVVLDGNAHANTGASGNFAAGDARFWSSASGTAHDVDDRVIYNTSTGELWYDADGNGAGARQLIATLQGTPSLSATDIAIVNGSGGGGGQVINGTSGNDSLVGGPGSDTINGFAGNDTLVGLAGDDVLDGGTGADSMDGGFGNDTFYFGFGDVLVDAGGIDTLVVENAGALPDGFENLVVRNAFQETDAVGNSLDNIIRVESAEAGSAVYVDGRGGNDTLDGAGGFIVALFSGSFGNDSVAGGARGGWLDFSGSASPVVVQIASGSATSSAGNVTFTGIGNVIGSQAADRITASNTGNPIRGFGGDDTLIGGDGNDSFFGEGTQFGAPVETFGTGNDSIFGGAGNDTLFGNDGNDTLDGGRGNDRLGSGFVDDSGGSEGNDTFVFTVAPGTANADVITDLDSGADVIILDSGAHANAGPSGNFITGDARFWSSSTGVAHDADDRVVYNTSNGQLWYDLDGNGVGAAQLIATLEGAPGLIATDIAIDNGGGVGGVINGTSGDDSLVGGAGNDTLNGFAGEDTIDGFRGADSMVGGEDPDTYFIDNPDDVVVEFQNGGIDTVNASVSYTLAAWVDNLTLTGDASQGIGNELDNVVIDNATAAGASITGYSGNDTLIGGNGPNIFRFDVSPGTSSYGQDSVDGGGGNDVLFFENNASAVTVDFRNGTVTGGGSAPSSVTFVNIEQAQGTLFNDVMFAGAAGALLLGYGGNDTLTGGAVHDFIRGDSGFDVISGAGGNDHLQGDEGNDSIDGGVGNDFLFGGEGMDSFFFTVAPGQVNADEIAADFLSVDDQIVLDGTVHANSGASGTFVAGDARFWSSSTGVAHDSDDRVIYNTSNGLLWYDADGNGGGAAQLIAFWSVPSDAPPLTAADITIINGGGGGGGGSTINGTSGNDTLTGTAGNDAINGLGGNDLVLVGSTGGADVIDGGAGADSIEFASRATSAVVVDFGAGTITGGSSGTISFTGVERIVASNFNDSLTGNAGGQTLAGQAGADTIWGAGGVDTLWGGGGADTFIFRETGSANADSVRDWASGADKVALDNSPMSALGAMGNFATGDARFWSSSTGTAHDANDRVIYDISTGSLYYDADGNGAGTAQLIATFQGNPAISATDIVVI